MPYSDYFPTGSIPSKILGEVRCLAGEANVSNHKWFEIYLRDFLLENYNKNQSIAYGCLLSEFATDVVACTGGEVVINGVHTAVATPSNVTVTVDGWTVFYINTSGVLISTVGSPLINTNIQNENAPDSGVLLGFAKRTETNFVVYPIQNFLDLRISQQLLRGPIYIGDSAQVTAGIAQYTINTLPVTSVTDTLIFIDGATNTLTADRVITCNAKMQSPKGSINLASIYKLTLSGAKVNTDLIVNNAGDNKLEVTAAGGVHNFKSDNNECLVVVPGATATHNGVNSTPGMIIQVVQNHVITASSQSLTANTRANITNLNQAITLSSTSSKVLIRVSWHGEQSANNYNTIFGLKRDSTDIGNPAAAGNRNIGIAMLRQGYYNLDDVSTSDSCFYEYLDSPASLSAITYYATIIASFTGTLYNNRTVADIDGSGYERLTSTITLMEIAG